MSTFKALKLKNFKSYAEEVCIEWSQYSSIIGRNGAGKSTIIDAIEFVLCFPKYELMKVDDFKLSIYCTSLQNHSNTVVTDTSVTVVLCKDGNNTAFERVANYHTLKYEYFIDDSAVTKKVYKNTLLEFNINGKANNFLVQQHSIESVATLGQKGRCELFERLSDSIAYKSEYNKLSKDLDALNTETTAMKKELETCLKRKRKFEEVFKATDDYSKMHGKLKKLKSKYYAAQLYDIDESLKNLIEEEKNIEKSKILKTAPKKKQRLEKEIENLKNSLREYQDRLNVFEEKYKEKIGELSTLENKMKENAFKMEFCTKTTINIKKSYESAKKIDENREKNIQELYEQRYEVEKEIESFITQTQACSVTLEDEQYEEYSNLKCKVQIECTSMISALDSLKRKCNILKEMIDEYHFKKDTLCKQISQKKFCIEKTLSDKTKIEKEIREKTSGIKKLQKEYNNLRPEIDQLSHEMKNLELEIENLDEDIKECKITELEQKKDDNKKEVLHLLQSHFGEQRVINRLKYLCNCIDTSCQLAITKLMGNHMNSIVVKDTQIAKDCILFLQKHYKGCRFPVIETFIPLDFIKMERLDKIKNIIKDKPDAALALDAMHSHSQEIANLLHHIMGKYVICKTSELASNLSYKYKINCVSEDGTLYRADGIFSGGKADIEKRSRQWSVKRGEELKVKKDEKYQQLKHLRDECHKLEERCRKVNSILSNADVMKYLEKSMIETEKRLEHEENELSKLNDKLSDFELQTYMFDNQKYAIDNLIQLWHSNTEEMESVKKILEEYEDQVFKDFCEKLQILNIRQYEQGDYKKYEENKRRKIELDNHLNKILNEITYLENRDTRNICKELEHKFNEQKEEYNILKQIEKELQSKIDEIKLNEEQEKERDDLKKKVQELKTEIKSKLRTMNQIEKILNDKRNFKKIAPGEMASLQSKMHDLLMECKTNDVDLPLKKGSIDKINFRTESSESNDQDAEDSCIDENEIEVDYSDVINELRKHEPEVYVQFLKEKIDSVNRKLKSVNADSKSKEYLKEATEKAKRLKENYHKKLEELSSTKARFENIKAERISIFKAFFNNVSQKIDEIFKKLYGDEIAQAHIILTNQEEPYLDGIIYDCIIPKKKFNSMEALSGGEKTMAALAMILATYNVKPAPFLIFDEIDAALDNDKRRKVRKYFSQLKETTQIIIISHHDMLSSNTDAAIGISISPATEIYSSYAVHISLEEYDKKEILEDRCLKITAIEKCAALREKVSNCL